MKKIKVSQTNNKTITPCLWLDNNIKQAVDFYTSIFKNSKITNISFYSESSSRESGLPIGTILTISFELDGQEFLALNGGPMYKFTEAISFMVECKNQDEVDYYWKRLSQGGDKKAQNCGWLKDKFGLSWQIVPSIMFEVLKSKDQKKVEKVMSAMIKMKKLNVKALEKIFRN